MGGRIARGIRSIGENMRAIDPAADEIIIRQLSDVAIIGEGSVTGVFGPKGSAKSCVMALLAEGSRLRHGQRVFYFPESYGFHDGEPLELSEFMAENPKFQGAVVLVDELQRFFNKFMSASLVNQAIGGFFEMIRKLNVDFIGTSNSPEQIDEAFMPHCDLRLDCVKLTDDRCVSYGAGFHLKDCTDTAIVRVTDIKGTHGRSRYWDGKKRFVWRVRHLIKYYKLYNTFSRLSPIEMRAMNAEAVKNTFEDSQMNMPFEDFLQRLTVELIPQLVQDEGATQIVVYPFVNWLRERGIESTIERIQRACKTIGLLPVRGSGGNIFKLPPLEDLPGWLTGIISEGS
jgi:hypothetical protein